MIKRTGFGILLVSAMLASGGCDGGPKGPGSLTGTVIGGAVGAVTLEVVGVGIRGFQGVGDTRAYGAQVSQREGRHRVVLVHPSGGPLQFMIAVDDRGAPAPFATVLGAAGTDNRTTSPGGIEVEIRQ